jgi:hypothetical protein
MSDTFYLLTIRFVAYLAQLNGNQLPMDFQTNTVRVASTIQAIATTLTSKLGRLRVPQ